MNTSKTPLTLILSSFLAIALAGKLAGAVVGPSGYTNAFSVQPPAADWATLSVAGVNSDNYTMDTDVNSTITSAGVTSGTLAGSGNPAAANGLAIWSSSGFVQTRPTGNRYTALMAKFINNTGTNATQVSLSYAFTIAGTAFAEDAGKGTRVYFSQTGTANSWTNLATLNNVASSGSFLYQTNIPVNWVNGSSFFILFADDNGVAGTDVACEIDNFSLLITAGVLPNLAVSVTAPTNNATLASTTPIIATAAPAGGTAPFTVQYFTNSGIGNTVFAAAGSSATAPYSVNLGSMPTGTYHIYAVATDSAGVPATATSATNTYFVADPIALALTSPTNNASYDHNTSVPGSATVSGGTSPYTVQFFLDASAVGAPLTTPPYTIDF